jgi:hypothetical protein
MSEKSFAYSISTIKRQLLSTPRFSNSTDQTLVLKNGDPQLLLSPDGVVVSNEEGENKVNIYNGGIEIVDGTLQLYEHDISVDKFKRVLMSINDDNPQITISDNNLTTQHNSYMTANGFITASLEGGATLETRCIPGSLTLSDDSTTVAYTGSVQDPFSLSTNPQKILTVNVNGAEYYIPLYLSGPKPNP